MLLKDLPQIFSTQKTVSTRYPVQIQNALSLTLVNLKEEINPDLQSTKKPVTKSNTANKWSIQKNMIQVCPYTLFKQSTNLTLKKQKSSVRNRIGERENSWKPYTLNWHQTHATFIKEWILTTIGWPSSITSTVRNWWTLPDNPRTADANTTVVKQFRGIHTCKYSNCILVLHFKSLCDSLIKVERPKRRYIPYFSVLICLFYPFIILFLLDFILILF